MVGQRRALFVTRLVTRGVADLVRSRHHVDPIAFAAAHRRRDSRVRVDFPLCVCGYPAKGFLTSWGGFVWLASGRMRRGLPLGEEEKSRDRTPNGMGRSLGVEEKRKPSGRRERWKEDCQDWWKRIVCPVSHTLDRIIVYCYSRLGLFRGASPGSPFSTTPPLPHSTTRRPPEIKMPSRPVLPPPPPDHPKKPIPP